MLSKATVAIVVWGGGVLAWAHNLDQVNTHLRFDLDTINQIESRFVAGETLLRADDEIGVIFKSTPGPGTNVGAGGYFTFYIPEGTQVTGVEYGTISSNGHFIPTPLRQPAPMPLGSGSIAPEVTSALANLNLGPNILGQSAQAVASTGRHNGTLAGVYGDLGIFYSTDSDTVWRSFETSGGLRKTVISP